MLNYARLAQVHPCVGAQCNGWVHLSSASHGYNALLVLQVALEQSYMQQQEKVEAEQAQQAAKVSHLATAVAYKKVNLETAGLKDYQAVFELVVNYVCAAAGLASRTSVDESAQAEVSAAIESVFPLSGVAYFVSLPAMDRLQQVSSLPCVCQ